MPLVPCVAAAKVICSVAAAGRKAAGEPFVQDTTGMLGQSRPTDLRPSSGARLQQQCVVGFAGGLVGALAMNLFSRALSSARGGRETPGGAPGRDRAGRGVQPPQAEGTAENDATVRVGTAAYRAMTNRTPGRATRSWLGTAVHYAFGGAMGAWYAAMAERVPTVRALHGVAYGTAVWVVADEIVMPILGLSRGPRQLPGDVHAYALAGHWVYGATLESVCRFGRQLEPSR
jgi:uncharacterized membrane protein YagU involved in acid resistance